MDAALSPLRQMGIRILNYLDDWLILAQSEVELLSHRTLILSHLERLGLRVNFAKSALSPSQRVSFLGTVLDSARMRAVIAPERALAIQKLAATFKSDTARPLKVFQRMLGLMAAASPVLQLGLLRMRPLQCWLKPRVPHNAWHHGRLHIRVNQACDRDALAHDWPNLLLYAFPPIALLPQVVRRVREQGHKVLLVAPLWRNQPWLSELTQLLTTAPWPVPLRRDLLSQANGTIWHP